jgi:predicted component of type VI protein secretion system
MIAIRVVSRAGDPLGANLTARFDEAGGSIGRGADCTLVLPDPERRISRRHLQITWRDGRHLVRLISTNLLCQLNGVPLAPGIEYPLDDGADLQVGPFVLHARDEAMWSAPSGGADPMSLLSPAQTARPSVFHDLLHPAAVPSTPAVIAHDLDLVVGDTSGYGATPARPNTPVPAEELIAALYAGLGVPPVPPALRSKEQLELIGALLRSTVGGTLGLLASRTIAKRALGAGQTLPQMRQNNPLKFSPDVDTALARMLGPPQRGFLAPLAAVAAAFDDLRAHELAVLAGMRAALEAVLARFDPEELESRLASKGVWDNLMPVNRKARLWERYGEQHAELLREVEDDFDSLFGSVFVQAYEAQLALLGPPEARPQKTTV